MNENTNLQQDTLQTNSADPINLDGWVNPEPAQPQIDLSGWENPTEHPEEERHVDPLSGMEYPEGLLGDVAYGWDQATSAVASVPTRIATDLAQTGVDIGQAAYSYFTGEDVKPYKLTEHSEILDNMYHNGVKQESVYDDIASMSSWLVGFGKVKGAITASTKLGEAGAAFAAGAASDFTFTDPWADNLSTIAHTLAVNSGAIDADSTAAQILEELKTDKDGTAFENRLRNTVEGGVVGSVLDAGFKVLGASFKSAHAYLAKTGDKEGAAEIFTDTVAKMEKANDKLKTDVTPDGALKPEAKERLIKQAQEQEAIDKATVETPVSRPDGKQPVRAKVRKAEAGEKAAINYDFYKMQPELKQFMTDVAAVFDKRGVMTAESVSKAVKQFMVDSKNLTSMTDYLKWVANTRRPTDIDGAIAANVADFAGQQLHAISRDPARRAEMGAAFDQLKQVIEHSATISEVYGRGLVHKKLAAGALENKTFEELRSTLIDAGYKPSDIEKLSPRYQQMLKELKVKQDELAANMKAAGYNQEDIINEIANRQPEFEQALLKQTDERWNKFWRKAKLVQSELMLMNPKTAGSAIVSGFFQSYYRPLIKTIAGMSRFEAKQTMEGLLTMKAVSRQLFTEGSAFKGMLTAIKEGRGRITDTAGTLAGEQIGHEALSKFNVTLRTFTGLDEYFKTANYRAVAEAEFINNNRKMLSKMSPKERSLAIKQAVEDTISNGAGIDKRLIQYAQETTFSHITKGDYLASFQGWLQKHPATSTWLFPFTHTPFNIIRFAMKQTPLGYYSKGVQDVLRYGTKEQKAEMYVAWGVWSGAVGLLADKLVNGEATAGYPKDIKKRQAMQAAGIPPYAIKLGDTWLSLDRFDFAVPLKMALNAADAYQTGIDDGQEFGSVMVGSGLAATQAIIDNSMLMGLSQFLDAASEDSESAKLDSYVAGLATRVVPPAYQQLTQEINDKGDIQEALGLQEKLLRKIAPWTLADRLDWLTGNPVENHNVVGFKYADDETLDTLHMRLYSVGGVSIPSNKLSNGLDLTGEQKTRLTEIRTQEIKDHYGRSMYEALKDLTESEYWQMMPVSRKGLGGSNWQQKQAQKIITLFNNEAENRLMQESPELQEQLEEREAGLRELDVPHF